MIEHIRTGRRTRQVLVLAIACNCAHGQQPPEGADVAPQPPGYSSWGVQLLYGSDFQEPGIPQDVAKATVTFENAAGWNWGSSFFFVDILKSDEHDSHATEVYAEWFPSASLSKLSGKKVGAGFVRDLSLTLGINAGTKNTGAAPRVFLPGVTLDLAIPGFQFFTLGTYAYIDERGRFEGAPSSCEGSTTYQITPAWSLPFQLGKIKLKFDGFIDFIGSHDQCVRQIVSQPQLKLDAGNLWNEPGKLYVGIEWQYWDNKFGIQDLDESFPQLLAVWVF